MLWEVGREKCLVVEEYGRRPFNQMIFFNVVDWLGLVGSLGVVLLLATFWTFEVIVNWFIDTG